MHDEMLNPWKRRDSSLSLIAFCLCLFYCCVPVWIPPTFHNYSSQYPPRFVTQGEQRLFYYRYILSVVFNQGYFCHPGNIWQCLDIFLVVTPGEWVVLVSNGWRPGIMTYIAQDSLYHKELSSLKCQFCQHRKTLLYIRFLSHSVTLTLLAHTFLPHYKKEIN